MGRLDNKIALITGGAQGIGRAGVVKFSSEGASVVIVDINHREGEKLANDICNSGRKAIFIRADVSDGEDVKNAIDKVKNIFNRLDVLYNNASVYLPGKDGKITDIDEEIWDQIINTNLKSIYYFCKYSIPLMIHSGGGSIINTSSSAGLIGIPNCDAYTATKGATVALTRSLAVEYGSLGIRVNCIAPAAIKTKMLDSSSLKNKSFDEEMFLKLRTPLRRYGNPDEIASISLFLASEDSSYLNGEVIVADGGITINGDLSRIKKNNNYVE